MACSSFPEAMGRVVQHQDLVAGLHGLGRPGRECLRGVAVTESPATRKSELVGPAIPRFVYPLPAVMSAQDRSENPLAINGTPGQDDAYNVPKAAPFNVISGAPFSMIIV